MKAFLGLALALALSACSSKDTDPSSEVAPPNRPEVVGDSIVRGTATVTVGNGDLSALETGTTTVEYSNAASVNFKIDASALVAGRMTGNTLSLGQVTVSELNDNDLKICGTNGKTKCTKAIIRIYTTGATAGFVNTSEEPNYGVPVYASGLNPTTALILGSPGVTTQQISFHSNVHILNLSDFATPSYDITADFNNAGAGNYTMTLVVEYALAL